MCSKSRQNQPADNETPGTTKFNTRNPTHSTFRDSGLWLRDSGLWILDSGFGFRVSGFGPSVEGLVGESVDAAPVHLAFLPLRPDTRFEFSGALEFGQFEPS